MKKKGVPHCEKRKEKGLSPVRKIICVCESKKKKREIFFNRETYTRIIVIYLIIVKLFRVCLVVFSFKEKGFFM